MSFANDLLGSKPVVPDLPTLDLGTEQQKALAANINAVPGAEKIGAQVDLFNQQQIDKMLSNVIPNYKGITGQISQNLYDLNRGMIPKSVQDQMQLADASKMFQGGYAGSGMGRNLVARDFGLTSLQLTQQGLSSTENWMRTGASIYAPGQFNVSSMFVTPSQMAAFDTQERNAQFQRSWMQNQIKAQPAMWAQDLKEAVQTAISIYSHTPPQHAGTLPVQGSQDISRGDDFSGFGDNESDFSGFGSGGGGSAGGGGGVPGGMVGVM